MKHKPIERLLLVKESLYTLLEQEDVVAYILCYYRPLLNAEYERLNIEYLHMIRFESSIDYRNERVYQTMVDKYMLLDPRIRDNRLERFLSFLEGYHFLPRFTKRVGLFFWRAYLYDDTLLMRLLKIHNFLYSVPSDNIPLLLKQVDDWIMSQPEWCTFTLDRNIIKYFKPLGHIILYCLDQRIEEPILKWITFKDVRGCNVVRELITHLETYNKIKPIEKRYYEELCIKQKSSEWSQKRRNAILYREYR